MNILNVQFLVLNGAGFAPLAIIVLPPRVKSFHGKAVWPTARLFQHNDGFLASKICPLTSRADVPACLSEFAD